MSQSPESPQFSESTESAFPVRIEVRVRHADLGRDGSASTVGVARWMEDARIRFRSRRFERLVEAGGFGPFQFLIVSQSVERLAPAGRLRGSVQVHTGVSRVGRSSFTFEQAVYDDGKHVGRGEATVVLGGATGALALPDELIMDLTERLLPESGRTAAASRPTAGRQQRDHYRYFAPLRARIGDVDSNQHVNFMAQVTWYDEAVAAFTTEAATRAGEGGRVLVPDLAPWSYRIHYIGEVTYPGDYEVGLLARSSDSLDEDAVYYELGIFRGDLCLGVADASG